MQQKVIWQAVRATKFEVGDEWEQPVTVTARPIITDYWFGTTVGMFYRNASDFGYWYSSNICDLITAWRVAQILPRLKTMRNNSSGYDSTLCGLVIAMNGDRHEDRMRERAKDLDMTVNELDAELKRLNTLWPSATVLYSMWKRLSEYEQDRIVGSVRLAINEGLVEHHVGLEACVDQAEVRLRTAADQKEHEEQLIADGLDDKPWDSLKMLMIDLGVTNLLYTRGCGDFGEPSHFKMADLDREIMKELIGKLGGGEVTLLTSTKDPDDATAHWSHGNSSITFFGSSFGEETHPKVTLNDQFLDLAYVHYDHVTERFQVALRPVGVNHRDEDRLISIVDLRLEIGWSDGNFLEPGTKAPWVITAAVASDTSDTDKPPTWSWAWFKKLLHG